MKDKLAAMLVDKANLDQAKADEVADKVLEFFKDHQDDLKSLITDGGMLGDLKERAGKIFGR